MLFTTSLYLKPVMCMPPTTLKLYFPLCRILITLYIYCCNIDDIKRLFPFIVQLLNQGNWFGILQVKLFNIISPVRHITKLNFLTFGICFLLFCFFFNVCIHVVLKYRGVFYHAENYLFRYCHSEVECVVLVFWINWNCV